MRGGDEVGAQDVDHPRRRELSGERDGRERDRKERKDEVLVVPEAVDREESIPARRRRPDRDHHDLQEVRDEERRDRGQHRGAADDDAARDRPPSPERRSDAEQSSDHEGQHRRAHKEREASESRVDEEREERLTVEVRQALAGTRWQTLRPRELDGRPGAVEARSRDVCRVPRHERRHGHGEYRPDHRDRQRHAQQAHHRWVHRPSSGAPRTSRPAR